MGMGGSGVRAATGGSKWGSPLPPCGVLQGQPQVRPNQLANICPQAESNQLVGLIQPTGRIFRTPDISSGGSPMVFTSWIKTLPQV